MKAEVLREVYLAWEADQAQLQAHNLQAAASLYQSLPQQSGSGGGTLAQTCFGTLGQTQMEDDLKLMEQEELDVMAALQLELEVGAKTRPRCVQNVTGFCEKHERVYTCAREVCLKRVDGTLTLENKNRKQSLNVHIKATE
eukprot:9276597-Pyramimonas_sp.AAC.1